MNEASSILASEHSFFGDEQNKPEVEQNKTPKIFQKIHQTLKAFSII